MTILWIRNSALYHLTVTHVTKSVNLRSRLHVEHVVRGHSETAMSCTVQKRQSIEMLFGLWIWVGSRDRVTWGCTLAPRDEYD